MCVLGSIPTLCVWCCKCENDTQLKLIKKNTNKFDNDINKKYNKYLEL